MPTSKADRLDKLFERDSLPSRPDPNQPHIADLEILPKMPPAKPSWDVPKVDQKPKVTRSPPPTGRDIDQLTSSDDDEYIRAFKKTPAIRSKTVNSGGQKTSKSNQHRRKEKSFAEFRTQALSASERSKANQDRGDGISKVERDAYPLIGRFCLFTLVTKFCYKYMDDPNDRVSKHFFTAGKIWNRTWDMYYIYPPASLFAKPILLVPEAQVQNLLDEINSAFKISIRLPRDPFLLAFYQDGTPAPRSLGTSQNRETIGDMQQKIPTPAEDHGECPTDANPELKRCFELFKLKMERASAEAKRKGAAVKKVKARNRLAAHVNSCDALKRGQRYLGLRPVDCQGGVALPDISLSWDEQQRFEREQRIRYGHVLQPLDVEKLAPHPFDRDVIFISVDVESYERNHDLITEVGISTLDTADIKSVTPGHGGFNWMEHIRSRHFRISNHVHLRNTTFCTGDPERFLFGHSEFVSMNEIGRVVDLCFEPPYSADFVHKGEFRAEDDNPIKENIRSDVSLDTLPTVQDEQLEPHSQRDLVDDLEPSDEQRGQMSDMTIANTFPLSELLEKSKIGQSDSVALNPSDTQATDVRPSQSAEYRSENPQHRNIILIGHDLDGDLQYLSTLNSRIFQKDPPAVDPQSFELQHPSRRPIQESLDTANLYQAWKREANITSLAKVLVGVERTGWHLHNGGNDARYTLEALIGIMLGARVEKGIDTGNGEADKAQELERRIKTKQEAIEKEERENFAMWKHAMGDHVDDEEGGGVLLDPYTPAAAEEREQQAESGTGQGNANTITNTKTNAEAEPSHSLDASSPKIPTRDPPDAQAYPWSSIPRVTLDGGKPKAFQMPLTKSEKARSSSRRRERERDEVLWRLQEEGEMGRPA